MKKGSVILLGYGLGYIVLSIIIISYNLELSNWNIFMLSAISFLFALAEFFDSSFKYIVLIFRQKLFRFFARNAFLFFEKVKKYPMDKYCKSKYKIKHTIIVYIYWTNKLVANHFSRALRKQFAKLNEMSKLTLLCYILAPIILVILIPIPIEKIFNMTNSLSQSISLFPIGLLFINVFFEAELSNINNSFFNSLDIEVDRLDKSIKEFKDIYSCTE